MPIVKEGSKKKSEAIQVIIIKKIGNKFLNLSKLKSKTRNGVTQINHCGW